MCSQSRAGIVDIIVGFKDSAGLEPSEMTISSLLKLECYRTAIFGKWHCGTKVRQNPTRHGFDEFVGFLNGGCDYHNHQDWLDGISIKDHLLNQSDMPDRQVFFGFEPKLDQLYIDSMCTSGTKPAGATPKTPREENSKSM